MCIHPGNTWGGENNIVVEAANNGNVIYTSPVEWNGDTGTILVVFNREPYGYDFEDDYVSVGENSYRRDVFFNINFQSWLDAGQPSQLLVYVKLANNVVVWVNLMME